MYAKYLFDLARICNCPPPVVDALRYLDFLSLTAGIDAYHKARQDAMDELEG